MDQNDGLQQARHISKQIQTADKSKVYLTQPDYDYGYNYTPDEFVPVSDKELQTAIAELMTKIKHPTYHMYAAL